MPTAEHSRPVPWSAAALSAAALSACGGAGPAPPAEMLALAAAKQNPQLLQSAPLRAAGSASFDATALMDWAQSAYPQFFPGSQPDVAYDPYIYRYYPDTGNYLGVAGNDVYVIGPVAGGALTWVGTLAGFSCSARPSGCSAGPASAADAARFLAQATLGADRAEIAALQATTYAAWIDAQFALPRGQSRYDWLAAQGYANETYRTNSQGFDSAMWSKLITAADPLRQRMTLALSEILVVSVFGVNTNWRQFSVANYIDVLESEAFGNYRTLLDKVGKGTPRRLPPKAASSEDSNFLQLAAYAAMLERVDINIRATSWAPGIVQARA